MGMHVVLSSCAKRQFTGFLETIVKRGTAVRFANDRYSLCLASIELLNIAQQHVIAYFNQHNTIAEDGAELLTSNWFYS